MADMTIDECVEAVFRKLLLVYGRDFLSRYEGIDLEDVKADWRHELRGFSNNSAAFMHALTHLPTSKAPNVLEFRALLVRSPEQVMRRLDAPKVDPKVVRKALDEARALLKRAQA